MKTTNILFLSTAMLLSITGFSQSNSSNSKTSNVGPSNNSSRTTTSINKTLSAADEERLYRLKMGNLIVADSTLIEQRKEAKLQKEKSKNAPK